MPLDSAPASVATDSTALIPISSATISGEPVPTVDARDLHEFLEAGKMFAHWIKDRIAKYGFVDGRDYTTEVVEPLASSGNRGARIAYHLTLDMAKELAMVERNDAGKRARLYFIECERRAKAAAAQQPAESMASVLADPRKAVAALLDYAQKLVALEDRVADMAPKVAALETLYADHRRETLREVLRKFPGVNLVAAPAALAGRGYLFADGRDRRGGTRYRVRAEYRDVLFQEKRNMTEGWVTIFPTTEGEQRLAELYRAGKLPMKQGFVPA
jgi:phage anti-repressor protein